LIEAILANPAGYYVNVHTEEFPAGAIRGQLNPYCKFSNYPSGCSGSRKKLLWVTIGNLFVSRTRGKFFVIRFSYRDS